MTRRNLTVALTVLSAAASVRAEGGSVNPELKKVVENFVNAVDKGDVATVEATYSPDFLNIRVADDGGFAQLTGAQILSILKAASGAAQTLPTKDTVIHHAEIVGDSGYVLMTRVKNLGNGWEPMFYSLVWHKSDGKWFLQREFVHQKSFPKWH